MIFILARSCWEIQIQWKPAFQQPCWYGHLVIAAILVWSEQKLSQIFYCSFDPFNMAILLIQPNFCGWLVAGLTGFHCNWILYNYTVKVKILRPRLKQSVSKLRICATFLARHVSSYFLYWSMITWHMTCSCGQKCWSIQYFFLLISVLLWNGCNLQRIRFPTRIWSL